MIETKEYIEKRELIEQFKLLLNRSSLGEISPQTEVSVGEILCMINELPVHTCVDTDMCSCQFFMPCKIGDTVYRIVEGEAEPVVVDRIIISRNNELKIRARELTPSMDIVYLSLSQHKKKWFANYKEASSAILTTQKKDYDLDEAKAEGLREKYEIAD